MAALSSRRIFKILSVVLITDQANAFTIRATTPTDDLGAGVPDAQPQRLDEVSHEAVEQESIFSQLAGYDQGRRDTYLDMRRKQQTPVWVHAFARSGSSTVLSMVSKVDSSRGVFSLFEPCHKGDRLEAELEEKGCSGLISALSNCDFRQVKALHGWNDVHTTTGGLNAYDAEQASSNCIESDVITFKTVTLPFQEMSSLSDVLEGDSRIKAIQLVRDPRSIYASWFSTWPFNQEFKRDRKALKGICDSLVDSLELKGQKRIKFVILEELIEKPEAVMQDVFEFLEKGFGDRQKEWIRSTFNANACPGIDQWIAPYSDCHTESRASLNKWKTFMNQDEIQFFDDYVPCQKVRKAFNYTETSSVVALAANLFNSKADAGP